MSEAKKIQGQWFINLSLEEGDIVFPCPFCDSVDLELQNTHTATYWIECRECSAEVTGTSYGDGKGRLAKSQHAKAKASAIIAWNRRPPIQESAAWQRRRFWSPESAS